MSTVINTNHTEVIGADQPTAIARYSINVIPADDKEGTKSLLAKAERYCQGLLDNIKSWIPAKDFNKSLTVRDGATADIRFTYRTCQQAS